ncbi:uncharacterized protein LOC133454486 [Cololabis saira]|uniref:uncharacterized protein LOC133454486 n=1 Tax=Cololabis saira TaxID=129043 RepID=UPI002AD56DF3|nr:uncharacterized protein LOC133454486 [Cololabis saira]
MPLPDCCIGTFFCYGGHSGCDLCNRDISCSYTIRESDDREEFELVKTSSNEVVCRCPNFGRIEEEKREREEQERRKQCQIEEEKKRQEKLERQRQEAQRLEWERQEQERLERQEQERLEWERQEQERLEWERREQERLEWERQEQERLEWERREQEWREWKRQEQKRLMQERLEQLWREWKRREQKRLEQERREQERLEQERREQERLEQERLEQERLEQERLEQLWREWKRREQKRLEQERQEQERLEQERLEQERLEQERLEQERLEQERLEQLWREWKRREQKRLEQERREQERLEQERREQERLEILEWIRHKQEKIRCQQEEQQRKEKEEERRIAELERKRRIQEQIDKENEASRIKLFHAHEKLQQEQNLKAAKHHQQHSQILHQLVEDHASHIERDELKDVGGKFEELLSKYQISGKGDLNSNLEDRMKTLQNELTLDYLREHNIPIPSLWAFDQATGYVDLSLTEKFNILEAVVKVTVEGDYEDLTTGQDKKTEFLLNLQDQLQDTNPTLARKVLVNILETSPQLPMASREILSQILFNNIWMPKELKLFMERSLSMDQEKVTQILHKVCTYRLSCTLTLSALNDRDPMRYIQSCVSYELDKDVDTILEEMQDGNYPEHIVSQLENILRDVTKVLPKYKSVDINEKMIQYGTKIMISLDFSEHRTYCETLKNILIVLSLAVKKCTTFVTTSGEEVQGYFPRLTQLASLVLLLLPQVQDKRGCLLEIGTGEGKTCILAMFATIQAVRGMAVDIVTSSHLLAIRDHEQWQKLYTMFGVTSSTVPPQHQERSSFWNHDKWLEDAYRKKVIYGTVSNFAADILRQEFEKKRTRGDRKCDCVIVDEVDYMTLDSGVQVTFLSHQASGLRHIEQVLASIWAMVSACCTLEMFTTGEIHWTTSVQYFHKVAKEAVIGSDSDDFSDNDILLLGARMGFYSQKDVDEFNKALCETQMKMDGEQDTNWKAIENIMGKIGPKEQYELLSELQSSFDNSMAVDCYSLFSNKAQLYGKESCGRESDVNILLLQNGRACEIMSAKTLIDTVVAKLKSKIKYSSEFTLDSLKKSEGFIVIPSVLKEYIENQLPVFSENALKAIRMTLGREYMIDRAPEADRTAFSGAVLHQYDTIIPVDFQASGVLEKNKRWGEGLQQFLEMKHQLAISTLSNVTNYMSNVHFFKRYVSGKGIFGVSGTLGGEAEKAFLERQYKTASYVVPAHRQKKLVELPAVQVTGGNTEWIQVICETAWTAADRGQVVMIICEDVKTADELKTQMNGKTPQHDQITMYTISEKHNIEKQNFRQGNIIIATNLGGRGTDVHVQPEVNECGGLFVLLTYFPGSQRVERQVSGRTARKGNPGMIQMILNRDHLAVAYQGHSIETMRQLREEYEVIRLDSMERNELLEIEMKENLFSSFCEFLYDFDRNYTLEEKTDLTQKMLKDIPECFKTYQDKFDYQTAVSALKESWALWLTLHEEEISRHDDFTTLREDLSRNLKITADGLLQGRSNNFYDYIEMAKRRTDMHCTKKKESDFGALSYWQKAAKCDPFYSAVALYNQAYITINLQKPNCITEAKGLLEKSRAAVDVYLSELSNTMMFCNFSVKNNFAAHHKDSNLQSQMKSRMSVFKSWKGYIESALKTLEHIEKTDGKAIINDSSVYSLSRDKDPITTKELMVLHEFGLSIVFEVKKKPEFSVDALVCFGLGVLQVAVGVLVCILSSGSASQLGLGLISEGVSDMIHGVKGMLQGGFDWAEWAISKAISIGVSLVFGGLGRIRKAVSALSSGTKGLVTGAKCTSAITMKQCFKHAAKYAAQELGKQGCITVVNYTVDKGLKVFFQKVLKTAFKNKVFSLIKANVHLDKVLTDLICSGIPKTAMEQEFSEFKIDKSCEKEILNSVHVITLDVIPGLMMDCTKVSKVIDTLSELCGAVAQHMDKQKGFQYAQMCLESAKYITLCVQMLNSFPTEEVVCHTFVPQLLENMNRLPQEKYDQDGRHQLSDAKRLKDEIMNNIAGSVSESLIEACSRHLTSLVSRKCMSKINHVAGHAVSNILGRGDTHSFFQNQVYKHQINQAIQCPRVPLSEGDNKDLDGYIKKICHVDHPATAVDVHVLTQSDALQGKGIRVISVDQRGNTLTEDYYPGKNSSAGDIVLQLKKYPENPQLKKGFLAKQISGEQTAYSGHFEIPNKDGSVTQVHSEAQNCLYHAVAQVTSKVPQDLKQQAVVLRNVVKSSLQQDKSRYAAVLKLQRGYEETYKSPCKYTIVGGGKKTQHVAKERFKDGLNLAEMNDLPEKEVSIIKTYNLGLVGKSDDIKGLRRAAGPANVKANSGSSPVNADHIPPINTFQRAREMLQKPENRDQREKLMKERPQLYAMINENGNRRCREVLTQHHRVALTTGNSKPSHKIRAKLADVLVSGDEVKLMKMSLIVANPEMSESLRKDAGITRCNKGSDVLSGKATRRYHDMGGELLVKEYCSLGVIDRRAEQSVIQWQKQHLYSRNSPEYHELLDVLRPKHFQQNI